MAIVQKMTSYGVEGKKLSFAGWVSNISPTETPFTSMTGKEAISQTKFQWQTDYIPAAKKDNAQTEGSVPTEDDAHKTVVKENITQIFRRGVAVSDTANVVSYYGRGKEIGYQMEKASLELKRDIEKAFLSNGALTNAGGAGRTTAGFVALVAPETGAGNTDSDTGAKVHNKTAAVNQLTEKDLFNQTYQLYLANSKANIIMFHPKHAAFFSSLLEPTAAQAVTVGNRMKMFSAMADKYNAEVDTIVDPLGQRFALVPNRLMDERYVYFFNPADWTQMVLRAPKKIQLDKKGSLEEWMVEAEVGLRHRNPFASGVLDVKQS